MKEHRKAMQYTFLRLDKLRLTLKMDLSATYVLY